MAEQNGEKSFDATPYRRQKAREQGQVARSQDLTSAVTLLGALLVIMFIGQWLADYLGELSLTSLGSEPVLELDQDRATGLLRKILLDMSQALMPLLAAMMLIAVAINLAQVGILFLPDKLAFDASRINPLKGIGRLFSLNNLMKLLQGIFKILVVAGVALSSIWGQWPGMRNLAEMDIREVVVFLYELVLWTSIKVAVALLILALIDYFYQLWKFEQDLKMTHQEIKEELKTTQGDPHMAARRKQVQRQLALQRLDSMVPDADVVITNPTELAVALKYDFDTMPAPVVVAKGAGVIAQKIRRLALENGIPVIERKPLARALYADVDIGKAVPAEQYAAVAEVLRYVYELQGKPLPGQSAA